MFMKLIIVALWLACFYNLVVPFEQGLEQILHWVLIVLPVAHLVECIIFKKRVEEAEGDNMKHYLQIFIFGGIHILHLKKSTLKA